MSLVQSLGGWSSVMGWAVAVVAPFTVWLASRRKSDIDESAVILGKWKELVDAHEAAIRRLTDEFERERRRWNEENEALRKRVGELETENRTLRDEVNGLKRAIAQNSKSAAFKLGSHSRRNTDPLEGGE